MSFATDLMADAKAYVADAMQCDASIVPDGSVSTFVDKLYPGGWSAYESNFRRFYARVTPKAVEEFSPIKKLAIVQRFTGIRLSEFDQILLFEVTDLNMKFVISRATQIDRRSRRDIVTERTLQLWQINRNSTDEYWGRPDYVESVEAVSESYYRWGVIHTPERDASIREQVETCYRPGTSKTPMQGWIAKLEISWKEAHENEEFPKC